MENNFFSRLWPFRCQKGKHKVVAPGFHNIWTATASLLMCWGNIIVRVFGINVFSLREMLDEFDFNMNSLTFHISDSDWIVITYYSKWPSYNVTVWIISTIVILNKQNKIDTILPDSKDLFELFKSRSLPVCNSIRTFVFYTL